VVLGDNDGVDAVLADAAAGRLKALLLLRTDLSLSHGEAAVTKLGDTVDFIVVLDTHFSATAEVADVLLPIATFAETDGTFVNRQRRVQRIRESIHPPVQARPGWLALSELYADLGRHPVPADASALFTEMAAALAPLRHMSFTSLGMLGQPVETADAAPSAPRS
jgi:predicted molibdopterin-dependent oxidoreductase YjgC